jgi:hypothetical protein
MEILARRQLDRNCRRERHDCSRAIDRDAQGYRFRDDRVAPATIGREKPYYGRSDQENRFPRSVRDRDCDPQAVASPKPKSCCWAAMRVFVQLIRLRMIISLPISPLRVMSLSALPRRSRPGELVPRSMTRRVFAKEAPAPNPTTVNEPACDGFSRGDTCDLSCGIAQTGAAARSGRGRPENTRGGARADCGACCGTHRAPDRRHRRGASGRSCRGSDRAG